MKAFASIVVALVVCWRTTGAADSPVCIPGQTDGVCAEKYSEAFTCPVWETENGWVLAGQKINRNQPVPGLRQDLVIPWKQHSRRAFPRWGRHHYFYHGKNHDEFFFAPGLHLPLECHKVYSNLVVDFNSIDVTPGKVSLNPKLVTDRVVAKGDPLYLPCVDKTLSAPETYENFPLVEDIDGMLENSFCLDQFGLEIRESNIANAGYGAFTGRAIPEGQAITWGRLVHMHRSELRDPSNGRDEVLLNYCWGHPDSPLLLLPMVSVANAMNHATEQGSANVRVQWPGSFDPELFFTAQTEALFGAVELSLDLKVEYVALRNIQPGEELLLDYGSAWQEAWKKHLKGGADVAEFRHEIGLPDGMLPAKWIKTEVLNYSDFAEWLLPTLKAAELSPVKLSSGEGISGQVDRVGLPEGLTEKVATWANEIGLTDIMRSYILGDLTLPEEGEQRLRLNGATWWMKRFPEDWKSDMHYISPDDHEANTQFMQALGDAGFDQVLEAVGKQDGLESITVYYPSFIAVSHCRGAFMHNDSDEDGHYNVIFPVLQINSSGPELVLGDEETGLYVPYKYERDHAVVLGNRGFHGTAPCDYRGTDQMRMVVSVYMVDADNPATRDAVLTEWEDADPPFPRIPDRPHFLDNYKHWKRDDPNKSLSRPL